MKKVTVGKRKATFRKSDGEKSEREASIREEETVDRAKEDEKAMIA